MMLNPQRLSSANAQFEQQLQALFAFEAAQDDAVDNVAREVIAAIRSAGDAALLRYTEKWDRWQPASPADLFVPVADLQTALANLNPVLREALQTAAMRIRDYHQRQVQTSWQFAEADGTVLGQRVTALDRVGLYVPGGKAAYPSSVLMNAIAAKVAGVREIVMVTPTPDGVVNQTVLAAAAIAGVDQVLRIGGAQAVAALAFGTASIRAVDKIVGPGNAFVAAAKRRVFGVVGIDMIAGPSEIAIIADGSVDPDCLAMDLFSQAEHDETAQAVLVCPYAAYLERVLAAMNRQLDELPRANIIRESINHRGALIQVRDLAEACEVINRMAPEHLELALAEPEKWLASIRHAGAIFMGGASCESLGDYCAGPNHVLPTSRTARFSSPLGVYDFQKRTSLIQASPAAAASLGRIAATIARAEGLEAHARAADYRTGAQP